MFLRLMFPERRRYLVLDVEIDAASHAVRRASEAHHLRAQSMAVLLHLLEHRDRLVPKDELLQVVWRDVAVTDEALTQCIKEIRRALGDDHRQPRFLRTVPKAGYQIIAPVREAAAVAPTTEALPPPELTPPPAPVDTPSQQARPSRWSAGLRAAYAALLVGILIVLGTWAAQSDSASSIVGRGGLVESAAPAVLTDNAEAYQAYRTGLDHVVGLRGKAALGAFQRAVD